MEPSLSWGLRMAVATVVPVVWGVASGRPAAGEWIALSADCICWVALKGTYAQRLRILFGGAVLTLISAALGSITGASMGWSIACMLGVAFVAMLFKNLGERGSGLSLCLYVIFLIANAHPVTGTALRERLLLTAIGGAWNFLLGLTTILFLPAQQPYRRTIALIWRANAALMKTINMGWDGRNVRSNARDIYLAEKAVREAIDTSFAFHGRSVHQFKGQEENVELEFAKVRKAAALVGAHMVAVIEELEGLRLQALTEDLRLRLHALLRAVQHAAARMCSLTLTRRGEDALLARDSLDAIPTAIQTLEDYKSAGPLDHARRIRRIIQLCERCAKMMARSMERLESVSEESMLRSYSVLKTLYILHPKYWWRSIRLLFSLDSHTARYAVRTALAATVAMAIYKIGHIDHGYWLPFTVIIVVQPYFIATWRKALDRTIGTVAGGVAGGLFLLLPAALHLKEAMLFCSAMAMVHFFRVRYRVSAFFITLNLVLLLSVSQELNKKLILLRAEMTIGGAIIAVGAGFLLLPAWDRRWLPRHIAKAFERNWWYFRTTFLEQDTASAWTRYKRQAEVANSNAFDSFNRAMQEPGGLQREYSRYYQIISHNVQVTRQLNNIHLEEEAKGESQAGMQDADAETKELIGKCTSLFATVITTAERLSGKPLTIGYHALAAKLTIVLNAAQKLYLARLSAELQLLKETLDGLVAQGSAYSDGIQLHPTSAAIQP